MFNWYVSFTTTPRSKNIFAKTRWAIVAPTWDLIKHDWSKLKPSIWVPYREAIIAEKVFEGGTPSPEIYKKFREAVDEHTRLEPHHDYKYNNPTGEIKPNLENFADWYSVSKARDPKIPNIRKWLQKWNTSKKQQFLKIY